MKPKQFKFATSCLQSQYKKQTNQHKNHPYYHPLTHACKRHTYTQRTEPTFENMASALQVIERRKMEIVSLHSYSSTCHITI